MQGRRKATVLLGALLALGLPAVAHGQVDNDEEGGEVQDEAEDEEREDQPSPPDFDAPAPEPTRGPPVADPKQQPVSLETRPSAKDFEGAPLPHEASGTMAPRHRGASVGRKVGRVLLFVPRWTAEAVFALPRLGLWTYNRFQLNERFKSIFFNDEGTLGLYPVAFFETGFGLNIGARFIMRELFKGDGKLQGRVSYGGRFRQLYSGKLETGRIFKDRLEIELEGAFQIFPKSRFFGIGNDDDFAAPPDAMDPLIDPINDDAAVKTRYRHDDLRFKLVADIELVKNFSVRFSGTYVMRDFDEDAELRGDADILDVYDRNQLVGFNDGLSNIYPEIELVYDSRRRTSLFHSAATSGTGWKLAAFLGYQKAIDDADPSEFFRYGLDVQKHLNLYNGDRFLILRAYLEAVTGDIEEVPFVDLPRIGGPTFLRGYDRDRFRDRIATLYTVEYNYPMAGNLSAFVFTDTGRVYRDYDSVTDQGLDDLHVGFGAGIQGHTKNTFITRATVYSSIDGDLFFNLSFDPVFDTRSREETP